MVDGSGGIAVSERIGGGGARRTCVIVGGGLAGAKGAEALRAHGFDGRIVLVGDEPDAPYSRIALSKDYLMGRSERRSLDVHEPGWYERGGVELRTGRPVTVIDRAERTVTIGGPADGAGGAGEGPATVIGYDALLLATGSRPRAWAVPGADSRGVHRLYTAGDAEALFHRLTPGARIVIVGGGWLGLEAAAAARTLGCEVTVLARSTPLARTLGPRMAELYAAAHHEQGVDVQVGAAVDGVVAAGGRAVGVRLADGTVVDADTVVAAVGSAPNVELAAAAGLEIDDGTGGVATDEHLRTSDPHIWAAGDIAAAYHPRLGRRVRMEHWANALNQPDVAARSMLGMEARYERIPYFFSDQYELGMECSGQFPPGPDDELVVRGGLDERLGIAFWLRGGIVRAAMNINVWDATGVIQSVVRSGRAVDPVRLADESVPLADVYA